MSSIAAAVILAQIAPVPDSGSTGLLMGIAVLVVGLTARFISRRKP